MLGPHFSDYLHDNYGFLINTPLSDKLIKFVIEVWTRKNRVFSESDIDMNKLLIRLIYDKNPQKYLVNDSTSDKIYEFVNKIRKDIKYPDDILSKKNNFDSKLFDFIIKNIINYDMCDRLEYLNKDLIKMKKKIFDSKMPNSLLYMLEDYIENIIDVIFNLYPYIDLQKSEFIKNYYRLIYDKEVDKDIIHNIVMRKYSNFENKVSKLKEELNLKYHTIVHILDIWLPVYELNKNTIKVYDSSNEEINIYEHICIIGETKLIEIISPVINTLGEKKINILNKMSSGTKRRCHKFFISKQEYNIQNCFREISKNSDIQSITNKIISKGKVDFSSKDFQNLHMKVSEIVISEIS